MFSFLPSFIYSFFIFIYFAYLVILKFLIYIQKFQIIETQIQIYKSVFRLKKVQKNCRVQMNIILIFFDRFKST